jgi:hypothetical protein
VGQAKAAQAAKFELAQQHVSQARGGATVGLFVAQRLECPLIGLFLCQQVNSKVAQAV